MQSKPHADNGNVIMVSVKKTKRVEKSFACLTRHFFFLFARQYSMCYNVNTTLRHTSQARNKNEDVSNTQRTLYEESVAKIFFGYCSPTDTMMNVDRLFEICYTDHTEYVSGDS